MAPVLVTVAAIVLARRKGSDAHHVRGLELVQSRDLSKAVFASQAGRFSSVPILTDS